MTPDDPRHGTPAGRHAHLAAGQDVCEPCRLAHCRDSRIRAHEAYQGRSRLMTNVGLARRIRALRAIGWSLNDIGARLGIDYRQMPRFTVEGATVSRRFHDRMVDVYDDMADHPPTDRFASRRSKIARDRGCMPPIAWDDIDDPEEVPSLGVHVRRTKTELLEEFDWLVAAGESEHQAARQLGVKLNAIEVTRARVAKEAS